jgi:hypothetical protein
MSLQSPFLLLVASFDKIQVNMVLDMNGTHQALAYADYASLIGGYHNYRTILRCVIKCL